MVKKFRSVITCKVFFGKRILTSIFFEPMDDYEILSIINRLSSKKSTGAIEILVTTNKEAKCFIGSHLSSIFHFALENSPSLNFIKIAKRVPMHKGRPKADLLNYRLLSILSRLNKILKTLIKNRLLKFWENA